jgi:hypothetical protein
LILADTSAWIASARFGDPLLEAGTALAIYMDYRVLAREANRLGVGWG